MPAQMTNIQGSRKQPLRSCRVEKARRRAPTSNSKDAEMKDAEPALPNHRRPQIGRTWAGTQYFTSRKAEMAQRFTEPPPLSSYIGPKDAEALSCQQSEHLDTKGNLANPPRSQKASEIAKSRVVPDSTRLGWPKRPPPTSSPEVWAMRPHLTSYLNYLVGNSTSSILDAPQDGVEDLQNALPDLSGIVQITARDPKSSRWGELRNPEQPSPFERQGHAETDMPEASPSQKRQRNENSVPVPMAGSHRDSGAWVRRLEDGNRLSRAAEDMTEGVARISLEDSKRCAKRGKEKEQEEEL